MTLQITEQERVSFELLLESALPALRREAAYTEDRLQRRAKIARLAELETLAAVIRNAGIREAA